jgi:hypothetical protein
MESFDFDQTVLIVIAVLASLTRLVAVLFAAVKGCVGEYYAFREWLRRVKSRPEE